MKFVQRTGQAIMNAQSYWLQLEGFSSANLRLHCPIFSRSDMTESACLCCKHVRVYCVSTDRIIDDNRLAMSRSKNKDILLLMLCDSGANSMAQEIINGTAA